MRAGSLAILSAVLGACQCHALGPSLLGASPFPLSQQPLQVHLEAPSRHDASSGTGGNMLDWKSNDFEFKTGADVFIPSDLVELPRPGEGIPNAAGDLVLVSMSSFSFKTNKNNKSIWLAPLTSKASPLEIPLANGGDAFWLDDRTVGHVVATTDGKAHEIYAISVQYDIEGGSPSLRRAAPESPVLAGTFPEGVVPANFRYARGAARLVFSAYVYADGDLSTVKKQDEEYEARGNSALVYDETYERHWDTWTGPKRSKLFSVGLQRGLDEKYKLGDDYAAPLKDYKHDVPVEPFGGTDDFDVSETHIVYTAKDPKLPPAWHTKQNIYIVDLLGKDAPVELTSGKQGATRNPVFSRSGTLVAWTELAEDGYESDRAVITLYNLDTKTRHRLAADWDRSPEALSFAADDAALTFTAGEHAHVKVWGLAIPEEVRTATSPTEHRKAPLSLTHAHAASAPKGLPNNRVLFSQSSFTSPNDVFLITFTDDLVASLSAQKPKISVERITSFTETQLQGKTLDKGESFWFKGAEGIDVQGWALKPTGWKEGKKKSVPVVLFIHGGPQGAWEDQWSTRWNPNVFAQQGYFVVAINPTGSTTFGQDFTDAIAKDWGGRPFEDLRKGWKHILSKYPEIDTDRAVAAGASWGGYAINWIQGHPEYDFGFKALVCHDGVFDSPYNGFSTDELFFFNHDFGGRPWDPETKPLVQKFSPSSYVANWSTPQLIIHGSKDYRLPDTEGIGAFHALQQQGIPSRLVIFPDENHWVLKHGNSLKWHFEVFRWFDRFVGESAKKGLPETDKPSERDSH